MEGQTPSGVGVTLAADDLLRACERFLGRVTLVSDMSWQLGDNKVVQVSDGHGRSWIAKAVRYQESYERELYALRRWAPALGPGVHEQAGRLTRRLHDAEPPVLDGDIAASAARRLEIWISRGAHLLSDEDIGFSREEVRPLATIGPVPKVPCHLDNQPRNWLVDDAGAVSLIDFGMCKQEVWVKDVRRLYVQQWVGRPDLRDAFFSGYGRTPTAAELTLLRCYVVYSALSTIVYASEHADVGFEEQGRRTLAELRAGTLTVS
jgi:hypothetical protein